MAKGSYNISVSGDSNFEEEGKNNNESQECMNSCLNSAFLRSLSLHDRPRSSRVPTNKELRKSRYKALVSTSLEKIPSQPPLFSEARSECDSNSGFESVGINDAETESTAQPSIYSVSSAAHQETGQNLLSESDSWLEDRYARFSVESEKLLEKTVAILRTVDEDVSESLTNLTKPESIASEAVVEIYRNKNKNTAGCSMGAELDVSVESFTESVYENGQPSVQQRLKDARVHSSTSLGQIPNSADADIDLSIESSSESMYENWQPPIQQRTKDAQAHSTSRKQMVNSEGYELDLSTESSSQPIYENWQPSIQQRPRDTQAQSTPRRPKNLMTPSSRQNPENEQTRSTPPSPKIVQVQLSQQSPKNLQAPSSQPSPKNLQPQSSQQNLKNSLVPSAQETFKNFKSHLSSNSGNIQSLTKPDSGDARSVEQSPRNLSPRVNSPCGTTKVKSLNEFNLPSDHEQFIKIMGALQTRCLEYREMIQDIAVSALEECLNFSERSISRIRHFRWQFESQKRNFRDFKELCCKSVVFGPDSLPINEKVTEVIQSFYLKLLQEENETFMARLEFGLKMGEVYANMVKLETESKKIITTLEKEILYMKKTSVGFKV